MNMLAALPLLFAAAAASAAGNQAEQARASNAWIRVLPGDLPAGAYVTLENTGDEPIALTGAKTQAYAETMLHQSSNAGGTERMAAVQDMSIPPHSKASLAPGGYHLMLSKAKKPVKPGDSVPFILQFADGSGLVVDFQARPANATGP